MGRKVDVQGRPWGTSLVLEGGWGAEELGSSGFGRRDSDICGEPWGPNQASAGKESRQR